MNYKNFDRHIQYKQDKYDCIKQYNRIYKTNYQYYSELIHKEYILGKSGSEIAKVFSISKNQVYKMLRNMGVQRRPKGGYNAKN